MRHSLSGNLKFIHAFLGLFGFALLLSACHHESTPVYQGYVEGELIYIASPFGGTLQQLYVSRGQAVKPDDKLFTLDPEPEKSQLQQARQELRQAQFTLAQFSTGQRETILAAIRAQIQQATAELELAHKRVLRNQELYAKRAIEKDALDAATAAYQAKQAQVEQFQANLAEAELGRSINVIRAQQAVVDATQAKVRQAEWALRQKNLTASINARVFDNFFWPGEWVNPGQPVLALLAPEHIRVIFFIPVAQIAQIKSGDAIHIQCDACQKTYTAKINYISPKVEYTPPVIYSRENNHKFMFRVQASLPPEEAVDLHPGQPVYVSLAKPVTAHER